MSIGRFNVFIKFIKFYRARYKRSWDAFRNDLELTVRKIALHREEILIESFYGFP